MNDLSLKEKELNKKTIAAYRNGDEPPGWHFIPGYNNNCRVAPDSNHAKRFSDLHTGPKYQPRINASLNGNY